MLILHPGSYSKNIDASWTQLWGWKITTSLSLLGMNMALNMLFFCNKCINNMGSNN